MPESCSDGAIRIYRSRVRPQTVIRERIDVFVEQLFDADVLPLMRHLVEERGMTSNELEELRRIVDQLENQQCRNRCYPHLGQCYGRFPASVFVISLVV